MKKMIMNAAVISLLFFTGTCLMVAVDTICLETTGYGGKLVLDVEKTGLFN